MDSRAALSARTRWVYGASKIWLFLVIKITIDRLGRFGQTIYISRRFPLAPSPNSHETVGSWSQEHLLGTREPKNVGEASFHENAEVGESGLGCETITVRGNDEGPPRSGP